MKNPTDHPIHNVLASRWSPYSFDKQRKVDSADLKSVFEAARWAASSFNEQPWRYVVANKETDSALWERVLSVLVEDNQAWAKFAPVLAIGLTKQTFSESGKENQVAKHDLGAASACLTFEAEARGLAVHQMAGIEKEKIREVFSVPEDVVPVTALAIGYAGQSPELKDEIADRDNAKRTRKAIEEFVLEGKF